MKTFKIFSLVMACALSAAPGFASQVAGESGVPTIISCPGPGGAEGAVGIPVRMWVSAYGRTSLWEIFSVTANAYGFVPVSPSNSNGIELWEQGWDYSWTEDDIVVTSPTFATVRMELGKEYLVNGDVDGTECWWQEFTAAVPEGYAMQIDGMTRPYLRVSSSWSHQYRIRLVAKPNTVIGDFLGAGVASSLAGGVNNPGSVPKISLSLGLGSLLNGERAGAIRLTDPGYNSSWAALFTPAGLSYQSISSEVSIYWVSNAIRQIVAPQTVVDIVTINSTSYEVRYYNPADASSSGWPRTFSGSPFITYKIEQGVTSTTLKVTSTTSARVAVTTLERSGSWPTFTWTTKDWNTSTQDQLAEQVRQNDSGGSSNRNEQVFVRVPGGATAVEAKNGFTNYSWGEELTTRTLGTTNPPTTTYAYYDNSSDKANHRYLKSVVYPGGGWEAYEYWDPTGNSGRTGTIKRRYRPWVDSPSTVTLNAALGEVTYFDYAADPFGMYTRPTLVETKVNNVLTAKTTTSYSNVSGTTNGMNLVQAVTVNYSASAATLTTTTRYYREDTADAFFQNRVHSVVTAGNLKTSYARQRGSWNGSAFTKTGGDGVGAGSASRIAVIHGTSATGALYQTHDGYNIEDLYLVTNQSTMEVTIRDSRALAVRTESHVWTGSAWALIGWTNNTFNSAGLLTQSTSSNGAVRDWSWNGEQLASTTDEAGVVLNYNLYDHAGRVKEITKVDGPTTEFTYNAAGQVTQEKLKRTGTSETITVARAFDNAGRLTSHTPPGLSATMFGYNPSARTRTTTNPDSGTSTETYLLDGRLEKITGTAVVEQFYSYAIESDGRRRTQVNTGSASSARWAKTWTDWLGRTIQEDVPVWGGGTGTRAHTYDSAGRLWKTTQPGLAATLRTYDSMGNLAAQGLDVDASNTLAGTSNDRVRLYSTTIYNSGSDTWWLKQTESTYPIAVNATIKELGRTETKLTNLASGRLSHVESFDVHGNKTESYTTVDRTNKTVYAYVDVPDSTTNGHRKTVNGLLTEAKDTAAVTTTFTYDLLGRLSTSVDPRTGATTTTYVTNTARPETIKDPANVVQATYAYDTTGRVVSVKNADTGNKYAYYSYNTRSQKTREWGHTPYPVEYTYDTTYGQQTGMTTYATSTANFTTSTWPTTNNPQTTTWTFHEPTGLLQAKTDAASKSVDYTYTSAGQIYERKWARILTGSTRVTTTYAYSSTTGELTGIDYNDSTADITYTYNRLGSIASVSDNFGPRTFAYNLGGTLELQREDLSAHGASRWLTYEYDTATGFKGRPNAFKLGTSANPALDQHVSYTYQADGRLSTLAAAGQTFTYAYKGNSHLIESTSTSFGGQTYQDLRSYPGTHDWTMERQTTWGSTTHAKFVYARDGMGRVTDVAKTGTMFDRYATGSVGIKTFYGYNDRSELTSEVTKVGTGSTDLTGRVNPTYAYDKLGNRTSVTHNGDAATYAAVNTLNQYSSRGVPGFFDVAGSAASGAGVTVNGSGSGVTRHHEYFFKKHPLTNTSNPVFTTLTISDNLNPPTYAYLTAFLQKTPEVFTYDADGNLKTDGRWEYGYDAENRPNWIRAAPAAVAAGHPDVAWLLQYDYLGRRNYKQPCVYNGTAYQISTPEERFIYNGWNLVAEFLWNASTSTYDLKRSYTWGMDIAGPGQRAGGIGGLLMIKDGDNTFVPAYDGMGNLHALMTTASVTLGGTNYAAGAIVAAYEYDAFGQTIRESGPYAATNPFRFSTKYTDNDTGLVYFGLRYYSPSLGRFINRDPLGEAGGLNLYGFVGNNSVNRWDYLGLDPDNMEADGAAVREEGNGWSIRTEDLQGVMDLVEEYFDGSFRGMEAVEAHSVLDILSNGAFSFREVAAARLAQARQLLLQGKTVEFIGKDGKSKMIQLVPKSLDELAKSLPSFDAKLGPIPSISELLSPVPIELDRLPTPKEADTHWSVGRGRPIRIPFGVVDTSDFSVLQSTRVRELIAAAGPGFRGYVDDRRISYTTSGDAARILGDITLRLQGNLEVFEGGAWRFTGTLKSFDDEYDWDMQWTRPVRSAKTAFGRWQAGPGTIYDVQIRGAKPITEERP